MHYGYEIIKYCLLSMQVYGSCFVSPIFEPAVCTLHLIGDFFLLFAPFSMLYCFLVTDKSLYIAGG